MSQETKVKPTTQEVKPVVEQASEVKKQGRSGAARPKKDNFQSLISAIKIGSDTLAANIHNAGLIALREVNVNNDPGVAVRLVDALGIKHDKRRVVGWLTHFGKLAWHKEKGLIYRKRKDINEATAQGFLDRAKDTPYWKLTKQEEPKVTFDFLSQCNSIVKRYDALMESDDKEVTVKNEAILSQLRKIVEQYTPVVVH